jgi:hypothetical protein
LRKSLASVLSLTASVKRTGGSQWKIAFIELAEARKAARRDEERRQIEAAEAERRRLAVLERQERERERREELQRQMEAWARAREVRSYLAALSEAAQEHVISAPDGRLARWLRWAESYAERIDPLVEVESLPHDPEGYWRKALDLESFSLSSSQASPVS